MKATQQCAGANLAFQERQGSLSGVPAHTSSYSGSQPAQVANHCLVCPVPCSMVTFMYKWLRAMSCWARSLRAWLYTRKVGVVHSAVCGWQPARSTLSHTMQKRTVRVSGPSVCLPAVAGHFVST